jgi:anthranilate 1,2-dioxygenase small subunit
VAGLVSAPAASAVPPGASDQLLNRLRVEEFLSAYERSIDDDDLELWPHFFTEDGTYAIYPRENWEQDLPIPLLLCHGRDMMHDRVLSRREANIYAPHVYRHFHSGLTVTTSAHGIHAVSNYLVVQTLQDGESEIYQTGRAFDDLVEGPGSGLLIARRQVVYDTLRVKTLLVTPI